MANLLRRLVSGDKARLRDENLKLELDLVYLTNRVIIMGYPAAGVESLYRNPRKDVVRYLKHHHGQHFWVYNLCPIGERFYSDSVFDGHNSRYPFPDHQVPPFAMMLLAVREMDAWISSAPERVAVLHCKAGKGRSGIIACAYLLYQGFKAAPVHLEITHNIAQDIPEVIELTAGENISACNTAYPDTLQEALDLHTSRRMRPPSSLKHAKAGVSIPSQRRWLYYWLLNLHRVASSQSSPSSVRDSVHTISRMVRITQVKLRTTAITGIRRVLATAAYNRSGILRTSSSSPQDKSTHLWMSLARYNDGFVDLLDGCEKQTNVDVGSVMKGILNDKHFDAEKMINTFMKIRFARRISTTSAQEIQDFVLYPPQNDGCPNGHTINRRNTSYSATSRHSTSRQDREKTNDQGGIMLDSRREVRLKIFYGHILLGWVWFIPSFQMAEQGHQTGRNIQIRFRRDEIDFPSWSSVSILGLEISLEWTGQDTP